MIIFLLIIAAICLFLSMTLISKFWPRLIVSLLLAATVIGSMIAMVANDREHLGMHKVTETSTEDVYSVSPSKQMSMILYKNIGSKGTERVYIYKHDKSQKKPGHTNVNDTYNKVKTTTGDPRLESKTTRWEYKNGAYKFWFGIADNNDKLIRRDNTFYIPKDWLSLSTTQAAKLQKLAKENQAKMKTEGKKVVKAEVEKTVKETVMAAMKKDPTMSPQDRQKLMQETGKKAAKEAAAKYQAEAMQKMIDEAKQSK
ncbi:DUF4811 domain-containing protein [Pediococcus argentinicus]|nr:DUF4811 domain-containing protein [Pediococcus argentinicus]NKZ22855.1 DUF4811 domain-containing protein [Pediococcus argentinicus]GEP19922.1 DUF4811 domain-containing protein [Pediococcus argentinicus]